MTVFAQAIRALERFSRALPSPRGTSVHFFDDWNPEVSAAYRALGGEAWLPETLLRDLVTNQRTHRKRVAVLHRDARPWAVVPLRLTGDNWQPLMRGIIDGCDDFLCSGDRGRVLAALRLNVFVMHSPVDPAGWANVRWAGTIGGYELTLGEHPERYWRSRDRWTSVLQARRRTGHFELILDDPDSAHWTIDGWHKRFDTGDSSHVAAKWEDRHIIADWGLRSGLVRSWALRDQGRWIAGVVANVDGGRLTFATVYRDPEYEWHCLGTRLFSEAFIWAYESGMDCVDLGGGLDYKRWWAPPAGRRWHYVVSPLPVHAVRGSVGRASALLRRRR